MLVGIYNNYLSAYGTQEVSRYDTHKKSELRSVYNDIIKKGKTSPVYKVDLNEDLQKYVIGLKESARLLKNTVEEFSADNAAGSGLNKKKPYSSDESKVDVSLIDADISDDDLIAFDLDVYDLATGQTNIGNFIRPNDKSFYPGSYSFDVNINSYDYEFQFNANIDENSSDVQRKLVRLINRANIGLTASIVGDENNRTAIKIESDTTGETQSGLSFNITPSAGDEDNRNPVDFFGLNKVFTYPSDAHFSVNGIDNSSSSNTFTVNNAYQVVLKSNTEEDMPVTIGLKNDADAIMENVQVLLDKFNSLSELSQADGEFVGDGRKLAHDIAVVAKRHRSDLESNGIMIDDSNIVSLDKALFTQTLNEGRLEDALAALNGFKTDLGRKANQISLDPMEYVKKTLVTYPNPHNTINRNPYMTSIYTGLFYNNYI